MNFFTIFPIILILLFFILLYITIIWQRKVIDSYHGFFSQELIRLSMLMDLLEIQMGNPLILSIYHKLRTIDFKDLPKDEKGQINFAREVVKDFHERIWVMLKNKVGTADTEEEKKIYEKRLSKLTDVINLLSSVDESSSMDYMKLIATEVQKIMVHEVEDE